MLNVRLALAILAFGFPCVALATPVFVPIDITAGTGSTASQTTTHPAGPAGNGIDGNTGNFTHTAGATDANPSWSVNFGRDETFNTIMVHNRDNCCADRLVDITVQVFDGAMTEVYNSGVTNSGNVLGSPAFIRFDLPGDVTGQSITVTRNGTSSPNPGVLSIGELQIGSTADVDLPLGTDITQAGISAMAVEQAPTSANPPGGGVPANGVDRNFGNFTHTNADPNTDHTWRVDFGEVMQLQRVEIFNRSNCCGERLRDIRVSVLDPAGATVFESALLNPGNVLAFSGTNQGGLDVDLAALNGGSPILGQTVVVTRTPDAVGPTADDRSVLQMGEVTVTGGSAGPGTRFEITEISRAAGEVTLTWNSKLGASYTIFRIDNLEAWTEEIDDGYLSQGSTTQFVDRDAGDAPRWFYRVMEEPRVVK